MIGALTGKIIDKTEPGKLIIDVNGVGYDVLTSLTTFFKVENISGSVQLSIHTVVREDAFLLYGFADKVERSLFRELIKINGVGPKLAIAILSSISPNEFVDCIRGQDATMLTKLPGIGKKTAERLVVELKDSLTEFVGTIDARTMPQNSFTKEAIHALVALGFKEHEAKKAINKIEDATDAETLIRRALQALT